LLVGDIGGDGDGFGAELLQFIDRRSRFRFVASDHRDRGAGFREAARHAKADAAVAAGDDGDLAPEFEWLGCHC
jgi:imidazole glycerol phosphate synthase subunit HisF